MSKKNHTPEEKARREKIRELLQMATCIFRNLRKRKNPTDFTHTRMKSVGFLYCRQRTRATSIH